MNASLILQDDDDTSTDESEGPFDCGHWIWDDNEEQLMFVSDRPPVEEGSSILPTNPDIDKIEFKDDIDVYEQQRFKKRYQRKGQLEDVVFLQGMSYLIPIVQALSSLGSDSYEYVWGVQSTAHQPLHPCTLFLYVKDIIDVVLYTAPQQILSPSIIKMLHHSMTHAFLRALIFFCQYYLQVNFEMERRNVECETRIPTENTYAKEDDLMRDLNDLRLLVAKKYFSILLGEGAMKYFHHMGPSQNGASLSRKDINIHKILIRISIQVVWIALARKYYDKIEMEVNRLLISEVYNSVEHNLKSNYVAMMTPEQRHVLFGEHRSKRSKHGIRSPLSDEILSKEHTNYQKFGLGKIMYPELSSRLLYMQRALIAPETCLCGMDVSVGILGMPRNHYDIMLREVKRSSHSSSSSVSRSRSSQLSRSLSNKSQTSKAPHKSRAYKMIALPPIGSQDNVTILPETFPDKKLPHSYMASLREQRQKWLNRQARLTQKKIKSPKLAREPETKVKV